MKIIKHPLSHYVDLLAQRVPFTFARYGDGEWLTILEFYNRHNSNGCTFTPQLSKALQEVLKRNNGYYFSILKIAMSKTREIDNRVYGPVAIEQWLKHNAVNIQWYNGDVFLDEMLAGNLLPLIQEIRKKRVLYVGNERLRGLNRLGFFSYLDYIQVPPINAFDSKDDILRQVFNSITANKIDFIGWSSGLAAKVFIDETYMRFPYVTQIDFGSQFDGYFEPLPHIKSRPVNNTGSRSYIRKGLHNFGELLKVNTGIEE